MAATKKPNIQSTERDLKQNVIAARNEFALYFQVLLFNVLQFQLNRDVFHRHDDKFFVRIWNLVWTKRQKRGKLPGRIRHLRYCTWAQQCSHFSFFFGPGFF